MGSDRYAGINNMVPMMSWHAAASSEKRFFFFFFPPSDSVSYFRILLATTACRSDCAFAIICCPHVAAVVVHTANARFSIIKTFTSNTLYCVHLPYSSINSQSRSLHSVRTTHADLIIFNFFDVQKIRSNFFHGIKNLRQPLCSYTRNAAAMVVTT